VDRSEIVWVFLLSGIAAVLSDSPGGSRVSAALAP
jgi:hypothetical protein